MSARISHAEVTLYVGPDKAYQSITAALATIPHTLNDNYEIVVDVPADGYVETGLDANVANFTLNGHTLIISGSAGGTIPTEVTYYMGDDIEYRQTSSSMVTIENISAGDEIARRTHSDGYFPNAPYEMFIKNHLGSTMTLIDEDGQRVDAVYDYFPYGKQKIVASAPGAAKPVTQTFTGKELDLYADGDVTGNDGEGRYYFGERYYDADVACFINVDFLENNRHRWSPYLYAIDNPIKFSDFEGMGPEDRVQAGRNMIGTEYLQETDKNTDNKAEYFRTANTKEALKYMDCAEFVCRTLGADEITKSVQWMAGSGLQIFFMDDKKFIRDTKAKIGDYALWAGHVGVVTKIEGEKIAIVHARGNKKPSAEQPIPILPSEYGVKGEFIGYFRPKVETPEGKVAPIKKELTY